MKIILEEFGSSVLYVIAGSGMIGIFIYMLSVLIGF